MSAVQAAKETQDAQDPQVTIHNYSQGFSSPNRKPSRKVKIVYVSAKLKEALKRIVTMNNMLPYYEDPDNLAFDPPTFVISSAPRN